MNATQIKNIIESKLQFDPVANAAIFNTMRILKKVNPGDTYIDNYMYHFNKRGQTFVDYYHLLWTVGSVIQPKKIMEIGCRTGISIAQLLSAMMDYTDLEVYLFDVFADGFLSQGLVKVNLRYLNIPVDKVQFIEGDSAVTVPEFKLNKDKYLDYLLIDGNHDKVAARTDLENCASLVREDGGLLFFDDIAPDGCNLIDVWEDFKASHKEFLYMENFDGKGIGIAIKKERANDA